MSKVTDEKKSNNLYEFRTAISETQGEFQIELSKIKFLSYSVELMCHGFEDTPLTGVYPILDSIFTKLESILYGLDDFEDFLCVISNQDKLSE